MKRHAPAFTRNREPILAVLRAELPSSGTVLEIASGSGEHALYFAQAFPGLVWQPSDGDEVALSSISAWREEGGQIDNIRKPLRLDAADPDWPIAAADALLCINMVHISPPEATIGLFTGAARILGEGAPLILYGPYLEAGVQTASSNLDFDRSLKARDASWGLRDLGCIDELGRERGFERTSRVEMPANNIMLIYRACP